MADEPDDLKRFREKRRLAKSPIPPWRKFIVPAVAVFFALLCFYVLARR